MDAYELSLSQGIGAIARGELTSEQWTRALLARIGALDPRVEAFAWLDPNAALALAAAADAAAALRGAPIAAKDIIDTRDVPTRMGSPAYGDNVPARSATVVERLERAGAFVLGKTVTTELAFYTPGKTRNPWNSAHTPGGSSMGSAASVACGMVAGALGTQTNGYRMAAPASLQQAVSWIDRNVVPGTTVLAPVREGKWIEGLSGRPALFSSAVRYSFRPDEWRRSLAADTLLRSGGALVNEYFFVRLTDEVANAAVPRGMAIGVNHGGEYLDLLQIASGGTRLLDASGNLETLATLPNLDGASRSATGDGLAASVTSTWSGERQGAPVTFREIVSLQGDASTLVVRASATTTGPIGFELELHPAQLPLTHISVTGNAAELTFAVAGSSEPQLRVLLSGAFATLAALPDGGLQVRSSGGPIRLLITDLSGAGSPTNGVQFLEPAELVAAYDVGAVLLVRDPAFEGRRIRLEALGFRLARTFGPYAVLVSR